MMMMMMKMKMMMMLVVVVVTMTTLPDESNPLPIVGQFHAMASHVDCY
jgi:hypothetical protein